MRNQVNGTHLAADSTSFLEKRRRGLVRFGNALVQHPVLSQEQLVLMFLTVPTVIYPFHVSLTTQVLGLPFSLGALRLAQTSLNISL